MPDRAKFGPAQHLRLKGPTSVPCRSEFGAAASSIVMARRDYSEGAGAFVSDPPRF